MSYSWPGSTGRRILGFSVMAIAIGGLIILFFAYVVFNYFSNAMNTLNATVIGGGSQVIGNVSSALQQTFNVSYSDPFTSTVLGYLNATVIGGGSQVIGNVSNALQQTFNVSYSDPFTSTVLGYLKPVTYFLYAVVTNERLFFTLVAVDLILIAFDVTWIEESEE